MTIRIAEFNLLLEVQRFLQAEGSRPELSAAMLTLINRLNTERERAWSKRFPPYEPSEKQKKLAANEKSLMEQLLDAGYPASEMDHHETDLYVHVTPLTTQIITRYCRRRGYDPTWSCPTFYDNITGRKMYDCAFQWIGGLIDDRRSSATD